MKVCILFVTAESREWVNIGAIRQGASDATRQPPEAVGDDKVHPSFTKYIPVPYESLLSTQAPMIVHDQVDRSEWIRAQLAVDVDRRRLVHAIPGLAVHRTRSDPSLDSGGSTADWLGTDDDDDDDDIDWTAVSPELDALCRSRKPTWRHTIQRT